MNVLPVTLEDDVMKRYYELLKFFVRDFKWRWGSKVRNSGEKPFRIGDKICLIKDRFFELYLEYLRHRKVEKFARRISRPKSTKFSRLKNLLYYFYLEYLRYRKVDIYAKRITTNAEWNREVKCKNIYQYKFKKPH